MINVGIKWLKSAGVAVVILCAQSSQAAVQLACYIEWQDGDSNFMSYNIKGDASADNIGQFTDKLRMLATTSPENQGTTLTDIRCVEESQGFDDPALNEAYLSTPQ